MIKLFYILLFLIPFTSYSQETVIYSNTLQCYGSCLDECDSVKTYIEVIQFNDYSGGYIHINIYPDSSRFDGCRNMDIKKWNCGDAVMYIVPWKNEWGVKSIYIDEDGVYFKHKHNIFKTHRFVYHNL